jgi:hypothetical protein
VPGARGSDREHTLPFPFQYTACPRFRLHPCHLEWGRAHSAAMNENLRSILTGTAALWLGAAIALLLTILRGPVDGDLAGREQTARLFLLGLAVQSLHFMEEFVTHFPERFPALLGLPPWSESFFVTFNLIWLSVWILSAIDLERGYRLALFPVWFFAIAAIANGIAHPMLAVISHGYFPGLVTAPVLGVLGVLLWLRLLALTRNRRVGLVTDGAK